MDPWELLLIDARVATMCSGRPGAPAYGAISDGALAIRDGVIAWVGSRSRLPANGAAEIRSLEGRWLTPALVDCHTHLIFAGDRGAEFERRIGGASYEAIAASGGGIMATVRATRAASAEELHRGALDRLRAMAAAGAATVEIKSGYGLDLETEIRMLEAARRLGRTSGLTVRTTLLAAHAVPPEFQGRPDRYLDFVAGELMPRVAAAGLADAVDAYCERIAFHAPADRRALSARPGAASAGQTARRPARRRGRRSARGPFRRAVRRSSRVHLRRRSRRSRRGRHGGGAASRRLPDPRRIPPSAGRRAAPARGEGGNRHRLQSRHLAAHLAAGSDGARQPSLRLDPRGVAWQR